MTAVGRWWDAASRTWPGFGHVAIDDLERASEIMGANPAATCLLVSSDAAVLGGKGGHYNCETGQIAVGIGGYGFLRALAHEVFHSVEDNLPAAEHAHLTACCAERLPVTTDTQRMFFGFAADADPAETAAHLYADWICGTTTAGFPPDARVERLFRRVAAGEFGSD